LTAAAGLLNAPNDERSWDRWSFDLQAQVNEINQAILAQKKVTLPQVQLYPAPLFDIPNWLTRLQAAMDGITGTLGIQNVDVESVDVSQEQARSAWAFSIYQEVYDARAALKI
jgi:hypothetical protein